eukprot:CAMPEP_0205910598 /NCGR_PEP_ID=MMETSP1325-20131115/4539_1 /ASSEMBLY_ACC=CAM_ASM_000708 /TAXON_ID=236786 /ORGANISM="Florenciella sp., Strain RCC1007" /LENGTH=45 /DNA_ID= /DNA_START= /DNA_END= /DNA_ORIENTATION=
MKHNANQIIQQPSITCPITITPLMQCAANALMRSQRHVPVLFPNP